MRPPSKEEVKAQFEYFIRYTIDNKIVEIKDKRNHFFAVIASYGNGYIVVSKNNDLESGYKKIIFCKNFKSDWGWSEWRDQSNWHRLDGPAAFYSYAGGDIGYNYWINDDQFFFDDWYMMPEVVNVRVLTIMKEVLSE